MPYMYVPVQACFVRCTTVTTTCTVYVHVACACRACTTPATACKHINLRFPNYDMLNLSLACMRNNYRSTSDLVYMC